MLKYILAFLLALPCNGLAFQLIGSGPSAVASYPDIIFYWSCDSTTADKSAGDTSASAQASAAIDTTTYQVGTGSCSIPSVYSRYDFTLNNDDLADMETGRIGMWVRVTGTSNGTVLFRAYYDANNQIKLYTWNPNRRIQIDYLAGGTGIQYEDTADSVFAASTWFFLEYSWNKGAAGNDFNVYINGSSVLSVDASSGTWTKSATGTMSVGDTEGNDGGVHIDQVIISNDPARDLYALRNTTDF